MNTIYIVVSSYTSTNFDDDWSKNEIATFDINVANDYIAKCIADNVKRCNDHTQVKNDLEQFKKTLSPAIYKRPLAFPKWASGLSASDITDEMRSKRIRIKRINAMREKDNNASADKFDKACDIFRNDRFMALGYQADDEILNIWNVPSTDVKFNIHELKVI